MRVKVPYQILFLLFVVFGLYYPSLFAPFISVDDIKMVNWLENGSFGSVWGVFRPGGRFYYRPLLKLTFLADHRFWGLQASFMHLENILIHGVNVLLVFSLARRAFRGAGLNNQLLPVIAGLVFALHPIQTESVNWISGRTDPLATLFVLSAMLTLVYALETRRAAIGLGAAILFLAGVMSKEMSLFALPALLFLVWRWPRAGQNESTWVRTRGALCTFFAGPFVLAGMAYLVARMARFGNGDPAINYVLNHFRYGLFDTFRICLKVFGFYVKKLFVPVPLNFAITNASDHYFWLGFLVLLLVIFLLARWQLLSDFLVVSFFLILPALIISLTDVAWTPLAERYLYLPSAFWSIAVVGGGYAVFQYLPTRFYSASTVAVTVLLFGGGWTTFQRNMTWQSNLTLFQDTVKKNPDYLPARNDLAIALMAEGRNKEAEEHLKFAQRLDPDRKSSNVHYNNALVLLRDERYEEAAVFISNLLASKEKPSLKFLRNVARVYEVLLLNLEKGEPLNRARGQLETVYQQIYLKTRDPFVRYCQAKLVMFRGDKETAAVYFAEAYRRAPESAYYKQPALILAEKMGKE